MHGLSQKMEVNNVVWRGGEITHIIKKDWVRRSHYDNMDCYIYVIADGRRYQAHQLFPANSQDALEYKLCPHSKLEIESERQKRITFSLAHSLK